MLNFETWDVFTQSPFTGNPLAIVHGADGLSTAQMQTIAREFNLSETIFVMAPQSKEHSARVRIFFPTAEIPFAGHPTIGCAICLSGLMGADADASAQLVLEEEAGLVPVEVTRRGGQVRAEFRAPVVPYAVAGEAPSELCAAALGLSVEAIGAVSHPEPNILEGGPRFLYIPLADLDGLACARPCEPQWSQLMTAAGVDSAWCYTPVPGGYRARMFSPTAGIPEDPATGSASAIFAAELAARGIAPVGVTEFTLMQGVEMGRASEIGLRVQVTEQGLSDVFVSGSAVPISKGSLRIPQA